MDDELRIAINNFFEENKGYQVTYPEDWTTDLEEYLNELGFDLSCILQYKTK